MTAWDSHERVDKSSGFCFFSVLFFYKALKKKKHFTSTSRKSWSFLHVAEKVSEVPNSKYHSLFFVLKETRQRELQRDQEKKKRWSVFPTSKPEACAVVASPLLCV